MWAPGAGWEGTWETLKATVWVPLGELRNLLLVVEREVPCCSVSQECFDEVSLVGFRSIRYPEGNANTFLWDPSQRYRFVF